jgi:hypothetical protein
VKNKPRRRDARLHFSDYYASEESSAVYSTRVNIESENWSIEASRGECGAVSVYLSHSTETRNLSRVKDQKQERTRNAGSENLDLELRRSLNIYLAMPSGRVSLVVRGEATGESAWGQPKTSTNCFRFFTCPNEFSSERRSENESTRQTHPRNRKKSPLATNTLALVR